MWDGRPVGRQIAAEIMEYVKRLERSETRNGFIDLMSGFLENRDRFFLEWARRSVTTVKFWGIELLERERQWMKVQNAEIIDD
jgi:hypothetical protein